MEKTQGIDLGTNRSHKHEFQAFFASTIETAQTCRLSDLAISRHHAHIASLKNQMRIQHQIELKILPKSYHSQTQWWAAYLYNIDSLKTPKKKHKIRAKTNTLQCYADLERVQSEKEIFSFPLYMIFVSFRQSKPEERPAMPCHPRYKVQSMLKRCGNRSLKGGAYESR